MEEKSWYVYILKCLDGTYYTGVTNDLEKRMLAHKSGKGSKYVARHGFDKILSSKICSSKSDALKTEYQIKQRPRNKKLDFFSAN